jgi:CO/xanthine dehydrogenase Mo-binding subunit
VLDYAAVGDSGTIIHPKAYHGQLLGRSVLGMSHSLALKTTYDQHYGLSLTQRLYQSRPPTILDIPRNMKGEALNIPDPETPVGARGIGEPPVAAGACAILNALSDALGDDIYRRAPVTLDTILMALEHGKPMQDPLTAHI